jgi:hypothetical protein
MIENTTKEKQMPSNYDGRKSEPPYEGEAEDLQLRIESLESQLEAAQAELADARQCLSMFTDAPVAREELDAGRVVPELTDAEAHAILNKHCGGNNMEVRRLREAYRLAASRIPASRVLGEGVAAITEERRRQIEKEGWTPDHDDDHNRGTLETAAICYASHGIPWVREALKDARLWPWDREWWKPSDHRRNLVKAGALIAAAIDKLDRKALCARAAGGA